MVDGRDDKAEPDAFAGYARPEDVLADAALTREQKVDILLRWEYDASERAVALEEGMPGGNGDELRCVLTALRTLTGSVDVEHTGPSKQHPICRPTIRRED